MIEYFASLVHTSLFLLPFAVWHTYRSVLLFFPIINVFRVLLDIQVVS